MATRTIDEAFGVESPPPVVSTSGPLVLTILMSVMKSAAGIIPKELWGLSRALDLVAPRGFVVGGDESYHAYCQRSTQASRYPIVSLRADDEFNKPLVIYEGIKIVNLGDSYNHPLDIPSGVEKLTLGDYFDHTLFLPLGLTELEFSESGCFDHSLDFPRTLKKLVLSSLFNKSINLPEELEYVKFGIRFTQPFLLPPGLKVLDLSSAYCFNHPLRLSAHLETLYLSLDFNYPITLPDSLHTALVGPNFREPITFGTGLRRLVWYCSQPVYLPNNIKELELGCYPQRLDLPEGLEKLRICHTHNFPLVLPSTLKSIRFHKDYELPLVVPAGCVRHDGP